jgi:hypothetical protein
MLSRAPGVSAEVALARHGEAEAELVPLWRGGGERLRRSRAANLSGVLLAENAALDQSTAPRYLQLALEAFQSAVRLDPGNDEAKFNLELLMALLAGQQSSVRGTPGQPGASGAGSNPAGSGY